MNQAEKDKMIRDLKDYYDFERGNAIAVLVGFGLGIIMVIIFIIHDITH